MQMVILSHTSLQMEFKGWNGKHVELSLHLTALIALFISSLGI